MSGSCLAETHWKSNFKINWVPSSCCHIGFILFIPLVAATNIHVRGPRSRGCPWDSEMSSGGMRGWRAQAIIHSKTWAPSKHSIFKSVMPSDALIGTKKVSGWDWGQSNKYIYFKLVSWKIRICPVALILWGPLVPPPLRWAQHCQFSLRVLLTCSHHTTH